MKKTLIAACTTLLLVAGTVHAEQGPPKDNVRNDRNYDIISHPLHPAKRDLPAPFKEFDILNHSDDDLKFSFKTADSLSLKVVYSEIGKNESKTMEINDSKKFDVDLDFTLGKDYSVDLLLSNDTDVFETTMLSKIENNKRILVNGVEHNSMVKKSTKGFRASYDEYEPNNTIADATTVWNDLDVYGTMSSSSDVDIFKITLKQKTKLDMWLGGLSGSSVDYELELWSGSSGTLVDKSYLGTGQNELIANKILPAGVYYAKIYVYAGKYESWRQYHFRWKAYQSWPLENTTNSDITSSFGSRWGTLHKGIDIDRGMNDNVLAAFGGTITKGNDAWKGNYVIIESVVNGADLQTRYYHMAEESPLSDGSEVIAGTVLGVEGNTGEVVGDPGTHLHFETRNGSGVYDDIMKPPPVDPMTNSFSGW